jgi:hypothetical protein
VQHVEVLGTCVMGGISTVYNSGEQHDQRALLYGGHNGVVKKNPHSIGFSGRRLGLVS